VSSFGDFEEDDAYDPSPADPEQVARRLHALRYREDLEARGWDELTPAERVLLVAIVAKLLGWLRRSGAMR
jgi:hypothetical protein